ncbi:7-carboxy-7-deazaguanine synthase QueE [Desulfothermus okinawensis JCM 13304]
MRLKVNEIFYSLQGEGPFLGHPFVFLRLSGCVEPYCPFCDTKYAWADFKCMTIEDIVGEIKRFQCKNLVITGGEPFLQWDSGLNNLVNLLKQESFFIQYETSGKVEIPQNSKGTVVCSPKYISGRWCIPYANLSRCDYFKLLANKNNLDLIVKFILSNNLKKEKIYIMPFGATKEKQLENMPIVFEFCKKYGLKMTPRLHILCFGEKKGI